MGAIGFHRSVRRIAGTFPAATRGASIIEFAMLTPIFFALLFAIFEAGIYFFVSSAVDEANTKAARMIFTGQAQGGSVSKDAFFDEVCDVVKNFADCDEKLTVDVARFDSFADLANDLSSPVCRDGDQADIDAIPFQPGQRLDIVRVRVCFLYTSVTPGIGLNLPSGRNGVRRIISTSIFRNEPF